MSKFKHFSPPLLSPPWSKAPWSLTWIIMFAAFTLCPFCLISKFSRVIFFFLSMQVRSYHSAVQNHLVASCLPQSKRQRLKMALEVLSDMLPQPPHASLISSPISLPRSLSPVKLHGPLLMPWTCQTCSFNRLLPLCLEFFLPRCPHLWLIPPLTPSGIYSKVAFLRGLPWPPLSISPLCTLVPILHWYFSSLAFITDMIPTVLIYRVCLSPII